jgi:hypothetical protein
MPRSVRWSLKVFQQHFCLYFSCLIQATSPAHLIINNLFYFINIFLAQLIPVSHYISIPLCLTIGQYFSADFHFCYPSRWRLTWTCFLHISVFWDVAPCSLVDTNWCSEELLPPSSGWFHSSPQWWRQWAPLKCQSVSTRLCSGTSQKIAIFTIAIRTSNLAMCFMLQLLKTPGICPFCSSW